MNEEMIHKFIQKIVECHDNERIRLSMIQLAEILERSQVDPDLVKMVKEMADYQPELYDLANSSNMSKEDIATAIRRAKTRIANEMNRNGRC